MSVPFRLRRGATIAVVGAICALAAILITGDLIPEGWARAGVATLLFCALAALVAVALAATHFTRSVTQDLTRLGASDPLPTPQDLRTDPGRAALAQLQVRHAAADARVQDLTHRLAEIAVEAERSRSARDVFLANMSHEVRTPMTAILGYLSMLGDPELIPESRESLLRKVRGSADHLLDLINDLLDLSQIESGAVAFNARAVSPVQVFDQAVQLVRPRAIAKGLECASEHVLPIPATIQIDPLRLRQILVNLLLYAISDTESGGIRATLSYQNTGGLNGQLQFQIADTGDGLEEADVNDIFNPLARVNSVGRNDTGLGLAIARRLADMMGAQIGATSVRGVGNTFTLTIPVTEAIGDAVSASSQRTRVTLPAEPAPADSQPLRGMRILYCEDGVDNQRIVAFGLRKGGAEVELADNGRIGVEMFTQAQAAAPYDLVLMDMQMPEMDGYAATRELRRRGVRTPIVALTAHAMLSDREQCLVVGCDDFAAKPIDRQALIALCARWRVPRIDGSAQAA